MSNLAFYTMIAVAAIWCVGVIGHIIHQEIKDYLEARKYRDGGNNDGR